MNSNLAIADLAFSSKGPRVKEARGMWTVSRDITVEDMQPYGADSRGLLKIKDPKLQNELKHSHFFFGIHPYFCVKKRSSDVEILMKVQYLTCHPSSAATETRDEHLAPSMVEASFEPAKELNSAIIAFEITQPRTDASCTVTRGGGLQASLRVGSSVQVGGFISYSKSVDTTHKPWAIQPRQEGRYTAVLNVSCIHPRSGVQLVSSKPKHDICDVCFPMSLFRNRLAKASSGYTMRAGMHLNARDVVFKWMVPLASLGKQVHWLLNVRVCLSYWPNRHSTLQYAHIQDSFSVKLPLKIKPTPWRRCSR